MKMEITVSSKQQSFINAKADEVLYGGAAGSGKSYGQLVDAFLFALKYKKSKQLILRRTFPELERSLIRVSMELYPQGIGRYNSAKHVWTFLNGSIIEFAYCDNESDVTKYQSAEYDVIRFDELTHFTEYMYIYLLSRIRGANDYPKQMKSGTNPGGIGHAWVKERFIDIGVPNVEHKTENGTRIFIPAKIQDNKFLMEKDPRYLERLKNLPEDQQKALLYGIWDIFEGQYFTEFDRNIHVIQPFEIPKEWKRYRTMDYGLDMLACYWIAIDYQGFAYVYRELYESDLIISDAAKIILDMTPEGETIERNIAPPDLWNRRQDSGKSAAKIFAENGLKLTQSNNDRVQGWYNLKEWLKPCKDEFGKSAAKLRFFSNCKNLIRTLPQLQHNERDANDVAGTPHELTHAPDAIRYFVSGHTKQPEIKKKKTKDGFEDMKPKRNTLGRGVKIEII